MNQNVIAAAMSSSGFYPSRPESVEIIQTHISWVFIAGDDVFKVKKAVDLGFLDFTTLEKRKFYCEEEVRLNRRLAPLIYRDVVEISQDREGNIVLGKGETVLEYAVHMHQIPADKMLKKLLRQEDFDSRIIAAVARKLVNFHRSADTGGIIDETGGIETVRRNHEENFSQTESFIGRTLSAFRHGFIRYYARTFLDDHEDLFGKRVREHKIRDCHGDLHLEHVVVTDDQIIIFDCIEFNERFRFCDVAAEVAFLAMDLEFNGYHDLSTLFVQSYIDASGDRDLPTLIPFYQCYYAFVRGKVTGFRLFGSQVTPEDSEAAARTAEKYFELALSYAFTFTKPTLILMAGLMGSGKSVISRELLRITGASVIRTDVVRKELCDLTPTERRLDDFGKGIYSRDFTERVYEQAFVTAKYLLTLGISVIIDASFKRQAHRAAALNVIQDMKADFFVLECTCSDDCALERLARRIQDKNEASDGRAEIYDAQKKDFDAVTEFPASVHLKLDTSIPPSDCIDQVIAFLSKAGQANSIL